MTELKERLRVARKDAGLSQAELSKKAGVKQPVISDLETGKQRSSTALVKIAAVLGVSPAWLDSGVGPKQSSIDPDDSSAVQVSSELLDLTPDELSVVRSVIAGLKSARS